MANKYLHLTKKVLYVVSAYLKRNCNRQNYSFPVVPSLSIETTNICNSKCLFCVNPVLKRPRETLPIPLFKKVIDEHAQMGGTNLDLNVTIGDPLLDKHLLDRARYIKQYPQYKTNGFVTTLQWLHLHDLEEFFNSGLTWISISTVLSGHEQYRSFFGVDMYEQMLDNLELLLTENSRRNKLKIYIDIKPTNESAQAILNHPDFIRIKRLANQDLDKSIHERTFYVDDWNGAVKPPPYLKVRPLYPRRYRPCQLLYNKGLMVFSNGNVGVCSCRDFEANSDLILGNVAEASLYEMWNGKKLAEIRSDWLTKNVIPNICKACRHYVY